MHPNYSRLEFLIKKYKINLGLLKENFLDTVVNGDTVASNCLSKPTGFHSTFVCKPYLLSLRNMQEIPKLTR